MSLRLNNNAHFVKGKRKHNVIKGSIQKIKKYVVFFTIDQEPGL